MKLKRCGAVLVGLALAVGPAVAHGLDEPVIPTVGGHLRIIDKPQASFSPPPVTVVILSAVETKRPAMATTFEPFKDRVKTRWDDRWFYVESDGMPDHPLMVGITRWIGRFPLPQNYTGRNAWQIPLTPVVAKSPVSAKTHFYRGAIAMAANGVPIFNPLTNGGRDTFLAGELDEFGGHAGNGEDYHYHTAPLHLQKQLGKSLPIGYALDGYPIYGLTEPDGAPAARLDEFNGHDDPRLGYHYHSTKTYPYVNGGFHGEVVERGEQVEPQPHADAPRPQPLKGFADARITDFTVVERGKSYVMKFTSRGQVTTVRYSTTGDGAWKFVYEGAEGRTSEETGKIGDRRGGGGGGGGGRPPPPPPPRN